MRARRNRHLPRRHRVTVAAILANARLFGNSPPRWREGRTRRPSQTARQAQTERRKARKRLRRFGKGNRDAQALADVLDGCAPRSRCQSGACAVCGRAFQRWAVGASNEFLARENGGEAQGSTALACIHCAGAAAPGKLDIQGFRALKAFVSTALASIGIEAAVLGLHLSANRNRERTFEPHWLPHFHGHMPGQIGVTAETHLRKLFPRCICNGISRPVQVTEFDGNLAGLAYPYKPGVGGREGYLHTKATAEGGTRTCRNTRGRPLTGEQFVEAALFMHRVGLVGRLLLHGVTLARRRDGSVAMRRK